MILRYIKMSIYDGLVQYITDNGEYNELSASINFNIPIDNDIFKLTVYPGATKKKKYLCILQAIKIQHQKENRNYISLQLITDKKILENLVNVLINDYISSLSRKVILNA